MWLNDIYYDLGLFFKYSNIRLLGSVVVIVLCDSVFLLVILLWSVCFFFFFQAEDGIRDIGVTGVQTCALPISPGRLTAGQIGSIAAQHGAPGSLATAIAWQESGFNNGMLSSANARGIMQVLPEIGRASCRERV